ncbi:10 kda heat shock protein [Anaeramoeba ignava]|uniref:20 kDa chaperonin, chloroplastic n=1 Tax=Anaeramoeba ignava TaxID=1746090 RepID=A0A9Q0RCL3_ANAIG|nr:10 kda heat shock protein [Anaeramoeba ignava]|eukprot:Anaeramoba_ignava/a492531_19.p1 GENE.a492531_19~~a492531_19.p1  ORF type:complete len:125 (-),score=39.83 a492531_19:69-443(-)
MLSLFKKTPTKKYPLAQLFSTNKTDLIKAFEPLFDRVLVKRETAEQRTKSGLYVPDSMVKKSNQGEVIATGTGRITHDGKVIPMSVKKGDKVLLPEYGGIEIKNFGDDYLLYAEAELLAKFKVK